MATEIVTIDPKEVEGIKTESSTLIESARKVAHAICDTPTLQKAADMLLESKRRIKIIKARFLEPKSAAKLAHQKICDLETELIEPYARVEIEIIKPAMATYESEQEKKRRVEEERRMAEARKKAEDERLAAAAELEKAGEKEAANTLMDAPIEVAPVVMPKVETPEGISYRLNWRFRIVNPKLIPQEFYVLDEKRIQQRVNSLKGDTKIPGIEIYSEKSVIGRT
jgi:hypothetical protein